MAIIKQIDTLRNKFVIFIKFFVVEFGQINMKFHINQEPVPYIYSHGGNHSFFS